MSAAKLTEAQRRALREVDNVGLCSAGLDVETRGTRTHQRLRELGLIEEYEAKTIVRGCPYHVPRTVYRITPAGLQALGLQALAARGR